MLCFKLVEQVLHIMLNQDYSRSLCYFRPQMYELLHYAILGKMGNMGKKLCKRLHIHRLNPLNNARFPMSYAVLNLTFLRFVRYSTKDFPDLNIYIIFK